MKFQLDEDEELNPSQELHGEDEVVAPDDDIPDPRCRSRSTTKYVCPRSCIGRDPIAAGCDGEVLTGTGQDIQPFR